MREERVAMRGPEVSVDSVTDSITGLPDGRVFAVVLERKIALARRTLKPISVVYFRIDDFESFAPYIREHAMRAKRTTIRTAVRRPASSRTSSATTSRTHTIHSRMIWANQRAHQARGGAAVRS